MHFLIKYILRNAVSCKNKNYSLRSFSLFTNEKTFEKGHTEVKKNKLQSIGHNSDNFDAMSVEAQVPKISVIRKEVTHECCHDQNTELFYYKNMSLFPTSMDFSEVKMLDKMTPNIIDGAYNNIEQYLDLQFKLLREDCFRPLINGIIHYMESSSTKRLKNIRVYKKVRISEMAVFKNRVGYNLDLSSCCDDLEKYKNNKPFMYGSLLLFTSDNFNTILCATVLNTTSWKAKDWKVAVLFESKVPYNIFSQEFLLVESEVYFEPYHRVLNVLQNASTEYLPMQRYIVDATKHVKPPFYLQLNQTYYIKNDTGQKIQFEAFKDNWPKAELFGLDDSQMDAFKFALTKEFVVIQGPPGTGKTYLGTTIAGTLLENLYFISSPILIICYTNHALDQFMEGLFRYTKNMVRLGKQSKSYALRNCKLNKVPKVDSTASLKYVEKEKELSEMYRKIKNLSKSIKECERTILAQDTIRQLSKQPFNFDNIEDDAILEWLLDNANYTIENINSGKNRKTSKCDMLSGNLKVCFSETIALDAIETLKTKANKLRKEDNVKNIKKINTYEAEIKKYATRLALFKEMFARREIKVQLPSFKSVYELGREERWSLYFIVVEEIQEHLKEKRKELYKQFDKLTAELDCLRDIVHKEKLSTVEVVGMTTTMAARRHNLLKMLKPVIIIVEEAAEVLETHIVASLTDKCKHLILIGDHQQLRPTSAHYILGRKYNLEVSLFERMVRNGVHSKTLTTQRRMRKNIMDLLVPTIYEKLDCHPSVLNYPDVRGMKNNLYFYDHNILEDSEQGNSFRNTYEAKWCVALANYLRKMEYESQEIAILTTYNAQVSLITEISQGYELLKDVLISTVDSFQGNESRIVILSLVRSNDERKIGFLSMTNRICVALSRAKEGLYIFGNMSCLEASSEVWRDIKVKLKKQGAIGDKLTLVSETFKEKEVNSVAELDCFT